MATKKTAAVETEEKAATATKTTAKTAAKKTTATKTTAKKTTAKAAAVEAEETTKTPAKKATTKAAPKKVKKVEEKLPCVTRKDLAYKLQSLYGYDLAISKKFVQVFFDTIRDRLLDGETVKLSSFGTFSVVQKSARPGRNLRTGEEVMITPRRVIRFRPSRKLRMQQEAAE